MEPAELVKTWVDAFNRREVDELLRLYHEDAINHQVAQVELCGHEAIRQGFEAAFAEADMVCEIENLFEDGDWVILEWKDPVGLRGCGFFQVVDGRIKFQRGYWDRLSFLRLHGLPLP